MIGRGLILEKSWTFILRERRKTEFGENTRHVNFANIEVKNYFDYYRLQIDCIMA